MAYKIYLYDNDVDCIGSGNLSSGFVQYQLELASGQDVEVHISSVGGSAFDAIAIYDLLKKYSGVVTTHVDALAASAASIVAMAGSRVLMSKYALMMIHKPMVDAGGNADELLKDVQMLNAVQARLAQIYIDKTGLDALTINSLINAVTWLSADQALDLGFIDEIESYDSAEVSNKVTNSAIIRQFASTAPVFYQRCINKILLPENSQQANTANEINTKMNTENKELIEKTTSVLDKILNFFKKSVKKSVTNKGTLHYVGALGEGVEVFNDDNMEDKAADDTYEIGNEIITVVDGKVTNVVAKAKPEDEPENKKNEDEDPDGEDPDMDDPDDDDEPEDKKVKDILVTNKVKKDVRNGVYDRIKSIKNKLNEQNALLVEARAAIEEANAKLEKTREEVKNEIKSDFTPQGSTRSTRTVANKEKVADVFLPTKGSMAEKVLNFSKGKIKK